MRLEPDAANVRGKAESYRLDHVMGALNTMWSGGSLAQPNSDASSHPREDLAEDQVYQNDL